MFRVGYSARTYEPLSLGLNLVHLPRPKIFFIALMTIESHQIDIRGRMNFHFPQIPKTTIPSARYISFAAIHVNTER